MKVLSKSRQFSAKQLRVQQSCFLGRRPSSLSTMRFSSSLRCTNSRSMTTNNTRLFFPSSTMGARQPRSVHSTTIRTLNLRVGARSSARFTSQQQRSYFLLKSNSEFKSMRMPEATAISQEHQLPEIQEASTRIASRKNLKEAKLLLDRTNEVLRKNLPPHSPVLQQIDQREFLLNIYDRNIKEAEKVSLASLQNVAGDQVDPETKADALGRVITLFKLQQNNDKSLEYAQQLHDLWHKKDKIRTADALLDLGNITYWDEELFPKLENTQNYFFRSLDESEDFAAKGRALNNIGCILLKEGQLDRAEEKFKEALFLFDKAQKGTPLNAEEKFKVEQDRIVTELNVAETKMEGGDYSSEVQAHLELNFKDYVNLHGPLVKDTFYHIMFLTKMGKCFAEHNVNLTADGCYSKAFVLISNLCREQPFEEHMQAFEDISREGAEISYKVGKEKGSKVGSALAHGMHFLRTKRKKELYNKKMGIEETKTDISNESPEEAQNRKIEEKLNEFAGILSKFWSGQISEEEIREQALKVTLEDPELSAFTSTPTRNF